MPQLSNEDVANRYLDAHRRHDNDAIGSFRAGDWDEELPQSGEGVRGHANDMAIMANWPGGTPEPKSARVVGSEDRWVLTPQWTHQRIVGAGEMWFVDATAHYPDGITWYTVGLFEIRDGKVHKETWWFGSPLPAPEWRSAWVERMDPTETGDRR